jgi:hypothetical protein
MALRELPSFTTNNANAADMENGISTADSCVCVCVCVCVRARVCVCCWYHKTKSMARIKKIARTLAKNNFKMST